MNKWHKYAALCADWILFREVGDGWAGWELPAQVLEDQLTLFQLEGADCAPHITTCPPSFK